jgi:hypothetical protein
MVGLMCMLIRGRKGMGWVGLGCFFGRFLGGLGMALLRDVFEGGDGALLKRGVGGG